MPSYFLALATGLIGTKYFYPLTIFALPFVLYVTEANYFFKNGHVKDETLRDMLKRPSPFVSFVKKIVLIGLSCGLISNALFQNGRKDLAMLLITFITFYIFIIQLGEKWRRDKQEIE